MRKTGLSKGKYQTYTQTWGLLCRYSVENMDQEVNSKFDGGFGNTSFCGQTKCDTRNQTRTFNKGQDGGYPVTEYLSCFVNLYPLLFKYVFAMSTLYTHFEAFTPHNRIFVVIRKAIRKSRYTTIISS